MRLLVTREDYFEAAMTLLAKEGEGQLKIASLCKALNVTTGSFYGYFGSFDGFVDQFLVYWEQAQTDRIVALSNAPSDLAERVRIMKDLSRQIPHNAEAAIRSWGHTNPRVAEAQKRVDTRRQRALSNLLLPGVGTRREANRLAMMGITLLVGLQQWRAPVTKRDFDTLFDEYERLLLSRLVGDGAAS